MLTKFINQFSEQHAEFLFGPFNHVVEIVSLSVINILLVSLFLPGSIICAIRVWKSKQTTPMFSFCSALTLWICAIALLMAIILLPLIAISGENEIARHFEARQLERTVWHVAYPIILVIGYLESFTIILPPYPPKYWVSTVSRILMFLCVLAVLAALTLNAPGRYI